MVKRRDCLPPARSSRSMHGRGTSHASYTWTRAATDAGRSSWKRARTAGGSSPTRLCVRIGAVLIIYVALLVWGFRRKRLRLLGIVLGFAGMLLSIVVAAVLTRVVLWLALRGGGTEGPFLLNYDRNLYSAGFAALTFTVASLWYLLLRKRANIASLMMGGLLWWVLLMSVTTLLLPGGAYIF